MTHRVISVVDPEARHVHKTVHKRQDGYKAHVAVEPDTGLFTEGRLAKACGEGNSEAEVGLELLDTENTEDPAAVVTREVLGDSAYGTAEMRNELAARGHAAVIKPMPAQQAVAGGFTLDDFTVDEAAATMTCPNGVTRPISVGRRVTFGAACRDCPLRARCTTSKTGRKPTVHEHDSVLRQARRQWRDDPDLRVVYRRHRPMVERSIAWLVGPKHRCRKLRYRGVAANDQWLHTRMAGLNLRRLLNLGLFRVEGVWAIA